MAATIGSNEQQEVEVAAEETEKQQVEAAPQETQKQVQTETEEKPKSGPAYTKHQNFWIFSQSLQNVKKFQRSFEPQEGDVWLASLPKTGTTWTKALLHCIVSVASATPDALYLHNPHALVPTVELDGFSPDVNVLPRRVLQTHIPFHGLPSALQNSATKIVYVWRNPRDTFVSFWDFRRQITQLEEFRAATKAQTDVVDSKEELFDFFCRGTFHGGPFAENVLSYSREHKKNPEKVFMLRYEDLQADCAGAVLKIGHFLGYASDVIEKNATLIAEKCSFNSLSNADVNKSGSRKGSNFSLKNSAYFREGKCGGWRDHFTPEMEKRIRRDIEVKLENGGIELQY